MRIEPDFDRGGYPTDQTLTRIAAFTTATEALDLARAAWHWPDFARDELTEPERALVRAEPGDRFVRFATGGWSGNESIVTALHRNVLAMQCWRLSACGGLHIFRYPAQDPRL